MKVETFIQPLLTKLLFVGVRVSLVVYFLPFFGSGGVAARIKAGLALALTALLYSVYAPPLASLTNINWFSVLAGEVAVGLALGLSVQFVFEALQVAGQVCGIQLGYSLESLIDPQTNAQTPVLSIYYYTVAILIFLRLNVHHWMLRSLAESFEYLPPGKVVLSAAMAAELIRASGLMLSVGVQIAAPITLTALMIDVGLGFIGRAAPQLPVMLVGISVKELLGVAIVGTTLALWPGELEGHFAGAIRTGEHLLRLAR
jgi:flagellar biosynthesis protein FliR